MSHSAPIVVHDSDLESDLAADSVVDSAAHSAADLAADFDSKSSSKPRALVSLLQPSNNFASWRSGVRLSAAATLCTALFDSSGSETETDETFQTPPTSFKTTAVWETKPDQKLKEDTGVSDSPPTSPPYDPFGPDAQQIEDDEQFAIYLDMDLNGRAAKAHASQKITKVFEEEAEPKLKKAKNDRSDYWKERWAKRQQQKTLGSDSLRFRLRFIKRNFCGVNNFNCTVKKGPMGLYFKQAVIPDTQGVIEHDLIISSNHFFHRITDDKVMQLFADDHNKIRVNENCNADVDLLFAATFPNSVFPGL